MVGRSEGKGEEERAEEMSDEPPGINQTSLKGLTQPCRTPLIEQGFPPAEKGAENSYPCLPPNPVPLQPSLCSRNPPEPQQKPALCLSPSLSPPPVSKARREKPTFPLPFLGVTLVPGSKQPCAPSCPLLRSA